MDELISITLNENHEPVVSGRDLHKALEIKTKYNDWLKRMIDYGFEESQDFVAIAQKRVTAQGNQTEYTDHVLKLDMAKEIAMLQRNEKSKEVRKYFRTSNHIERLNRELKRRSGVIGIFPDAGSLLRLMGSVLLERNDTQSSRPVFYDPAYQKVEASVEKLRLKAKEQQQMLLAS